MHLIAHRRNTLQDLKSSDPRYGVEVDIRSQGDQLITHHDPMQPGEPFGEWIGHYKHGTLILNVKEEGLEAPVLALMEQHGITDYFFLDQSFPFLVKWSARGLRKAAVRVSEYENVQTAMTLAGRVDWVWVDCFTQMTLTGAEAATLQAAGFKLCIVSPELQGRDAEAGIPALVRQMKTRGINAEAACTKRPDLWEAAL